jgi:hypothetical protein
MQPKEYAMKSKVIQGENPSGPVKGHEEQVPVVELGVRGSDARGAGVDVTPRRRVLGLLAAVPFTLSVGGLMLALGVVTGALWRPLVQRPLLDGVAFGLPALREGRWWTPLTGLFFAQTPAQYLPTLGGFLLLCGFAELRLGTRRVVPAALVTQLAGVLGAAALLAVSSGHGSAWADATALVRDVGFSAGALGAAAAASATLPAPWRGRVRAVLLGYGVVSFVYVGVLWDLEHLIAIGLGLAWGPRLTGRRRVPGGRLSRREYRLLAAATYVVAAAAALIAPLAASGGPLVTGLGDTEPALTSGIGFTVLWLLLAAGLRSGRRRTWQLAVGVGLLSLAVLVGVGLVLAVTGRPGLPVVTYTALFTVVQLVILVAGRRSFANPSRRRARRTAGSVLAVPGEDERTEATRVLTERGSPNRLAWITTWRENRWYLPAEEGIDDGGFVAYRVHAGVAVGLCDPVGATAEQRARLLQGFAAEVESAGLVPCLFSVTEETARHAVAGGWQALQVAEEAVIDLETLAFRGRAWQDVRTALNRAVAQGITHRLVALAEQPRGIQVQVRAISEQWTGDKGLPELGFTLGGVEEALDPRVRVGLAVDGDGTMHGLTSWLPVVAPGGGAPTGWTLDVMRRSPDGFTSTMEFLIASACTAFRDEGASVVSLSGVPLARPAAGESAVERGPLDAFLGRLGVALEPSYGFRSLQAFKSTFQPRQEPLYLVFADESALPRIAVALGRAYLPAAGVRDVVALVRARRSSSRA